MKISMNVRPEEKFGREVWWVLQKLRYFQRSLSIGERGITFVIKERPITEEEPSLYAQHSAIFYLENCGAIIIRDGQFKMRIAVGAWGWVINNIDKNAAYTYPLELSQPSFDREYSHYEKFYGQYESSEESKQTAEKTRFENGVLKYKDIRHAFHKGKTGDAKLKMLFKLLWDNGKIVQGGNIKQQGKSHPASFYAVQLNIATDAGTFGKNKDIQKQFSQLIKSIERILKTKGFPITIENRGDIQMVIAYK